MSDGVLLVNIGTPEAPTAQAIRPWLREFLSDPRVVDLPRWLWLPILYGVILPLRPPRLAPQYQGIWGMDGSPLLSITRAQRVALAANLGSAAVVVEAMRYGKPSIAEGLAQLKAAGVKRLVVLPLYPQYSRTTTESVFDALAAALEAAAWKPPLRFVRDYHADPGYVGALAQSVREHWDAHGRGDFLVLSFHGIPQRYAEAGDPYGKQCEATAHALQEALGLGQEQWVMCYQSRVGKAAWLKPYTDELLLTLPARGYRKVDVLCPGFSADCLETLDEIVLRYGPQFVAAGGQALRYVPALNARPAHIDALAALVRAQLNAP